LGQPLVVIQEVVPGKLLDWLSGDALALADRPAQEGGLLAVELEPGAQQPAVPEKVQVALEPVLEGPAGVLEEPPVASALERASEAEVAQWSMEQSSSLRQPLLCGRRRPPPASPCVQLHLTLAWPFAPPHRLSAFVFERLPRLRALPSVPMLMVLEPWFLL
jgi:hypothetical protein